MTCGNPIKHKIKNVVDNWLDMFSVERKLTDNQMECMQFGICDYAQRKEEEVPFFTINVIIYLKYLLGGCSAVELSLEE